MDEIILKWITVLTGFLTVVVCATLLVLPKVHENAVLAAEQSQEAAYLTARTEPVFQENASVVEIPAVIEKPEENIGAQLQIELPEKLPFLDSELCGILGNILENAVAGCMTLAEDERYLQLSLMTQHDTYLYIVATNSFSGRVVQQGARYISTKRAGGGLGLSSIASTVEKLGGNVRFYHKDREFYTDIMLPMHRHAAQ